MKNWLIPLLSLVVCASLTYWMLRPSHGGPRSPSPGATNVVIDTPATPVPAPTRPSPAAVSDRSGASMPSQVSASATASAKVVVRPAAARPVTPRAAPASAAAPSVESPPSDPPEILLDSMRTTMRQYGLMFGGNPVGTNPEITKALNGENSKHVNFLGRDGNRVNGNGELIDAWGTPYFFHQLSAMQMEIRSAGPDKTLWTADDLVIQ